jgi:general secretion pathway protein A
MIYENHFSLKQRPFTIAPNPEFLYGCGQYQEALAALEYGMLHRGGFVLLTGEVGTGKTTLCKFLLSNIPENTEVALILHPQLDRLEMLQLVCREFGVVFNKEDRELSLIEKLTEFLLSVYSKGGHSVLIIDEAQHLDTQVLELVRLLTNLETHQDKLLQIILLGQPELKARLQQYNMRQLNQRFTARFHLKPLSFTQMKSYVSHRIKVAGSENKIFTVAGIFMLHTLSRGIPRLANLIADRSLMGGYASGQTSIGPWIVRNAAKEVLPESNAHFHFNIKTIVLLLVVSVLAIDALRDDNAFDAVKEKVASMYSIGVAEQLSAELFNCNKVSGCWQGSLPVELLKVRSSSFISGRPDKIAINLSGEWQLLSAVKFPQALKGDGMTGNDLIDVRVILDNPINGAALKVGDYHGSIFWVRSVLDEWVSGNDAELQDDISTWQVIEPNNNHSVAPVQNASVYDQGLELRVKRFQSTYGLLVDGVIGSQTMAGLELLDNSAGGL